ncbi:MAG: SprB repeat-containing protein, partial [Bacteroidota bacterium]
ITVRDDNGCIFRVPFVLTEPAPLDVNTAQNNSVLCFGDSTASLVLSGSGGTPAYEYQLNNSLFQSSPNFTQLPAGNYLLGIRDQNGCVTNRSISVAEPPLLSLRVDLQQNVACFGGSSGVISVQAIGGVGNYVYSLNGGPSTTQNTFTNLSAGFYFIFVEDGNQCQDSLSLTITEPTALTATISQQKNATCFGLSDAWVSVGPQGGTAPYQYSLDGINYQTSNVLTGLSAGTYTVRIQDDSACVFNLPVQITEPTQLGQTILTQKDVDCFGNSTGALSLSGTGGVAPYLYDFDGAGLQVNGNYNNLSAGTYALIVQDDSLCRDTSSIVIVEPTQVKLVVDSVINVACFGDSSGSVSLLASGGSPAYLYLLSTGDSSATPDFQNLPAGAYTATVVDDSSCVATVNFTVTEPPLLTAGITYQQNVDCNGNASGAVGIVAQGGTPPYAYAIDGGAYSPDSNFVALAAGNYVVSVQDSLGCIEIVNITITEPDPLVPVVDNVLNIDCFGNATGEATIFASGGTPPYAFSMDSLVFQNTGDFNGLLAGPHSVWVRDDSACVSRIDFVLTEPDSLIGAIDNLINVDCNGNSTASFDASASGGTLPYSYQLNGGAAQNSGRFENLSAGLYQLLITDAQGCQDNISFQITEPDVLQLSTFNTDVICHSEATGAATVVPQGGTPPYQILWDDGQDSTTAVGLIAGIYQVEVTDSQGCQEEAFQGVGEPDTLVL